MQSPLSSPRSYCRLSRIPSKLRSPSAGCSNGVSTNAGTLSTTTAASTLQAQVPFIPAKSTFSTSLADQLNVSTHFKGLILKSRGGQCSWSQSCDPFASEIVRIVRATKETRSNSKACMIIAKRIYQLYAAAAEGSQHNARVHEGFLAGEIEVFINNCMLTRVQMRKLQCIFHTYELPEAIVKYNDISTRSPELSQDKAQVQYHLAQNETKANKLILQMNTRKQWSLPPIIVIVHTQAFTRFI